MQLRSGVPLLCPVSCILYPLYPVSIKGCVRLEACSQDTSFSVWPQVCAFCNELADTISHGGIPIYSLETHCQPLQLGATSLINPSTAFVVCVYRQQQAQRQQRQPLEHVG